MHRSIGRLVPGAAVLLAAWVTFASAGEVRVRNVPKVIMEAVHARFPNAKFLSAAKEKAESGNMVYEVSLSEKGRNIDVTLTPEGSIVLIEKEIDLAALPKPVSDSLTARYPRARYRMVEEVYKREAEKETLAYYEVQLTDAKKHPWAVEFSLEGAVIEIEDKAGEND